MYGFTFHFTDCSNTIIMIVVKYSSLTDEDLFLDSELFTYSISILVTHMYIISVFNYEPICSCLVFNPSVPLSVFTLSSKGKFFCTRFVNLEKISLQIFLWIIKRSLKVTTLWLHVMFNYIQLSTFMSVTS